MIKTPDFVQFILDDTHSRVLSKYIKDLENKINKVIELLQDKSFLDIDDISEVLNAIGDDNE